MAIIADPVFSGCMRILLLCLTLALGVAIKPRPAAAYDMDCAILLCMAGGFPPGAVCAAAYREMIRRITPWPSLPPFGICTYAGSPVAAEGVARNAVLDLSSQDYDWLRRTRVIRWSGHHGREKDIEYWSWAVRSCDDLSQSCQVLAWASFSPTPWPATFMTENDQVIDVPYPGDYSGRAVMVEFGDYEGAMEHSAWIRY